MPAKSNFKNIIKNCENCGNLLILKCTRDINRKRFCSRECNGSFLLKIKWKDEDFANKVKMSNNTIEVNKKKAKGGLANIGKKHSAEWKENQSIAICKLILDGKLENEKKHKNGYIKDKKILNKNNSIYFRSSYEEKFIKDMIVNDNILTILGTPFYIKYQQGKRYIPDFLLQTLTNKVLIEIKPESLLKLPINIKKFKAAKEYCKINNLKFKIITEKELFNNNGGYIYAKSF